MTDKVIYQDGDDLSETNLALMLAVGNQTDYKERGFGFNPDWTNNDLTIGTTDQWGNFAIIKDAKQAYYLLADQRTVSLPNTNGKNYVYLHHDPTQDDHIGIHVDSIQTPPTNPSLLIGTVDTSNQTYDDTINDSPDGEFGAIDTDETTINDSLMASGLTLSDDPSNPTTILDYLSSQHNSTLATSEDTVAGDNTATTIARLAPAASNNTDSFYAWIMGRRQGGSASFIDEVTLVGNDGLAAVNHQGSRNTVSRSYGSAVSGTAISLAIDDTGETYDVGVIMLGGGQKQ